MSFPSLHEVVVVQSTTRIVVIFFVFVFIVIVIIIMIIVEIIIIDSDIIISFMYTQVRRSISFAIRVGKRRAPLHANLLLHNHDNNQKEPWENVRVCVWYIYYIYIFMRTTQHFVVCVIVCPSLSSHDKIILVRTCHLTFPSAEN